ncbi:MAG: PilT protein domain protein, partial [Akkermansiaceae bacterium]|nr:PilT protein domain protein [Akkermansiaceae bacterium]
VIERLSGHHPRDISISVVTEFELLQGAARAPAARRDEEHRKVLRFASFLHIAGFDSECAAHAARVNAHLLNQGTPVSITDVFIGATALRLDCILVTNNTRDFVKMPGLQLEDWH